MNYNLLTLFVCRLTVNAPKSRQLSMKTVTIGDQSSSKENSPMSTVVRPSTKHKHVQRSHGMLALLLLYPSFQYIISFAPIVFSLLKDVYGACFPSNSIWPYLSSDLVRSEREYC